MASRCVGRVRGCTVSLFGRPCLRSELDASNLRGGGRERLPIFLYGSTTPTLEKLEHRLRTEFPDLIIAGSRPSRFRRLTPVEKLETVAEIRESGARLTFVGLGCPRQEVFAYECGDCLGMPLLAVGAAFAFHAGELPQAPPWMQKTGLEWLYRFAQEPRRLWKRYLYLNPLFLSCLAVQRLRPDRFESAAEAPPEEEMRYG